MFGKILKYELLNILRNRWVVAAALALAVLTLSLIHIAGSFAKAALSLSSILAALVPLAALLMSVVYSYDSERFTEALLTQPVRRGSLILARATALALVWLAALAAGILPEFLVFGGLDSRILLLYGSTAFLALVFSALGLLVTTAVKDRIRGIGLALGVWLYFLLLHDALALLLLLAFKEYPLDVPSGLIAALNPVGLIRLVHLMCYDASMLMSYSGAVMRHVLTGWLGGAGAALICLLWLAVPMRLAWGHFNRKDF